MNCVTLVSTEAAAPQGYCQCGCGSRTAIATTSDRRRGRIKGKPLRYVRGHHRRKTNRYVTVSTGFKSPCWIWRLAKTRTGYGLTREPKGKMVYAHRYYYVQVHGPIPADRQLDHLCRVPACVNPDHLEVVTARENIRRGNGTKLTSQIVEKIRTSSERQAVLADRYGVSQSHISGIQSRRT